MVSVEMLVAWTTLTATFFGGLIQVLRLCIKLATLLKAHGELVAMLSADLEAHSTLVPPDSHPSG